MLERMTVWQDRANSVYIQLMKAGSTVLTSEEMVTITKVGIKYQGVYYNSDDYPDYFDWTTYASTGKVKVQPGLMSMPIGSDAAELIIYDAANTAGIMWMQIAIVVRDDAKII